MEGNTSINPFFYGTYLAETKPGEPVTRNKNQAFQADAVGVAHQLTQSHFLKPHTFRLEWQPGRGGRLDWFVKGYRINETLSITGDGDGDDWVHVYELQDTSLSELMGSQIPIEPSYLIMNTAISSTWGFPFDTPDWCSKCFDCDDPKCACSFYPGFCEMIRSGNTTMYIDSIRIYQSHNASAHVGAHHTLGCDPPDYPTYEWITGHEYRYMRNPPFVYVDKYPLRRVQQGGGSCQSDSDCGGDVISTNWTAVYEELTSKGRRVEETTHIVEGRGKCTAAVFSGMFSSVATAGKVCACNEGFTGPHCLSLDHVDDTVKAHVVRSLENPLRRISNVALPGFLLGVIALLGSGLLFFLVSAVIAEKKSKIAVGRRRSLAKPSHVFEDGDKFSLATGGST